MILMRYSLCGPKVCIRVKRNPIEYWDVNIFGTINLLKIMDKFNCNNLIFSSATVYGEKQPPLRKTMLNPVNPMQHKSSIEIFPKDIFESQKKNGISLIYDI